MHALTNLGTPCVADDSCVATAFCGTSGVCEPKRANGQPCSGGAYADEQCQGYCDAPPGDPSAMGVCRGALGTVANVDHCTLSFGY
jgi:hypothetical protein